MKSLDEVSLFLQLYAAVLQTAVDKDCMSRRESARDLERIISLSETRGLPFFMLDLPALGQWFEQSLAEGHVSHNSVILNARRKASSIPRFFGGLLENVFHSDGYVKPFPCTTSVKLLRQLYLMAKKLKVASPRKRQLAAISDYINVDKGLPELSSFWATGTLGPRKRLESSFPDGGFQRMRLTQQVMDIVFSQLGFFNPVDYMPKHGPGAVANARSSYKSKYDFPGWSQALERVFPYADLAFSSWSTWADADHTESPSCLSSKMALVPKTYKGPRIIAAEPIAHQWCQQVVLDFLVSAIKRTSIGPAINFADQSKNAERALESSHTGSHATLDLSAASDRLSCLLVECASGSNSTLLHALQACRSKSIVLPTSEVVILRKFASMGSACTFPMQTLIFSCIAVSAMLLTKGRRATQRSIRMCANQISVFGDDIVVPVESAVLTKELLHSLDLRVNVHKSFVEGNFRESCGCDAYAGVDVTPVYLRDVPRRATCSSVVSGIAAQNRFLEKGYGRCADVLEQTIDRLRLNVPTIRMGEQAFGIMRSRPREPSKTRYNRSLQRMEHRVLRPYMGVAKVPIRGDQSLLQYFIERPKPITKWSAGDIEKAQSLSWRSSWEVLDVRS